MCFHSLCVNLSKFSLQRISFGNYCLDGLWKLVRRCLQEPTSLCKCFALLADPFQGRLSCREDDSLDAVLQLADLLDLEDPEFSGSLAVCSTTSFRVPTLDSHYSDL